MYGGHTTQMLIFVVSQGTVLLGLGNMVEVKISLNGAALAFLETLVMPAGPR